MTKDKIKLTLSSWQKTEYKPIMDSLDYFMALILDSYPEADLISVSQFINAIKVNFWPKYWKCDELELYLVQAFGMIYDKIDPIKNQWPTIKEKYSDLSTTINQTLSTDGSEQDCTPDTEITDIAVKKYIVAILNQSSTYSENSTKTEAMNRNLIDDLTKILKIPSTLKLINDTVLTLQPYIYDKESECGGCGHCQKCKKQEWECDDPYFVTLMRKFEEVVKTIQDYNRLKTGPKGDRGPEGPMGTSIENVDIEIKETTPEGNIAVLNQDLSNNRTITTSEFLIPKGEKGDKGDTGSVKDLATINGQQLDTGGDIKLQVPISLVPNDNDKTYADFDQATGKLRIWRPKFDGDKNLDDYSIIDSTVAGIESTDDTLGTTKYIDKFYPTRSQLDTKLDEIKALIDSFYVTIDMDTSEWVMNTGTTGSSRHLNNYYDLIGLKVVGSDSWMQITYMRDNGSAGSDRRPSGDFRLQVTGADEDAHGTATITAVNLKEPVVIPIYKKKRGTISTFPTEIKGDK